MNERNDSERNDQSFPRQNPCLSILYNVNAYREISNYRSGLKYESGAYRFLDIWSAFVEFVYARRSQGELAEQMGRENERLAARVRQYPPKGRAALKRFKDPRLDNTSRSRSGESLDVLRNYLVVRKPQGRLEGLMASIPSSTFARPSNLPLLRLASWPRIV